MSRASVALIVVLAAVQTGGIGSAETKISQLLEELVAVGRPFGEQEQQAGP